MIEELAKAYAGKPLFSQVSFQLNKRERCSLVGRNGSGKSTLLRIILGFESPDAGSVSRPKHYTLGYLEQHISFSHNTLLAETALALPEAEKSTPYRAESILFGLGFSQGDLEKDPRTFSGGYQLRIQLAKTLLKEPNCLLLDEPTNYLDIVSIKWLEGFLRQWPGEMIVISHDRAFLDSVSTHTMGFHRGKLYRIEGGSQPFYDHILQVEEIHEKTRQKIERQKQQAEDFIRRFGAKATKAKQAQSRKKAIARLPSLEKLASLEGLDFHFSYHPFPGSRLLQTERLTFQYPEQQDSLIQDLSFDIEPGDRIAIVGKNGQGKSTLLRLLAGELTPSQGMVKHAQNLAIGFFGQTNIQKLNPALTVEEEIHQANTALSFTEIRNICGQMLFSGPAAEKKVGILSGGEKSRVLLGKILASSCNLLLLDEPTNHLDIESIEALLEALESFPGSVVIVSHDEEILERIADRLIICRQSKQELFEGNYPYFLEKIGWSEEEEKKEKQNREGRKEDKKRRAEWIQERSRILTPLKKEIEALEHAITRGETEAAALQKNLEEALHHSRTAQIPSLTRQMGELNKTQEQLYSKLEKLYSQYEQTSKELD